MRLAISLAKNGYGAVNPNPAVGAVIMKNGKIIGKGYHEKYGSPHAEKNALDSCSEPAQGSTIYVTLEPCCHHGKTPPCTDAIIQSGVKSVVIGASDPNPLVAGKGIRILRDNGIEVTVGVLEDECANINEVFFHYIKAKTPFVMMKYAMTLDGKIATNTRKSKWITGEIARNRVHEDRRRYTAIMVGVETVIADDPLLTCRIESPRNPVRIICDSSLRTPPNSQIVRSAREVKTIIATTCDDRHKYSRYPHCEIILIPKKNERVDLNKLMITLYDKQIDSILLEGGATLNWSALQSGIVNKVQAYISPKLFGGLDAMSPISGLGVDDPSNAFFLESTTVTSLGNDYLIEGRVGNPCLQE